MKNPFKRTDVFACNFSTHGRFANKVSVYHVMHAKKCYPHGCIYFKWSCALKNKGKNCIRGFKHLGRLCEGCTYYNDIKVHYQPKMVLDSAAFSQFKTEIEDFEDWLDQVQNREVSFCCEVDGIKPLFKKEISGKSGQIRLDGYLLIAHQGFFGTVAFDDHFYARISLHEQERHRIAPGDRLEAKGLIKLDRGRILLAKVWAFDFERRSDAATWDSSQALVARQSARQFIQQPEACLNCPKGALIDVIDRGDSQARIRRQLYCLEGFPDPNLCSVAATQRYDSCMQTTPL